MSIKSNLKRLSKKLKTVGYSFFLTPVFEFLISFFKIKTPAQVFFDEYHLDGVGAYFLLIYSLGFFLIYCHTQIDHIIDEIDEEN